ncbi:MAG: hypothetical protein ACRDOA_05035 [Streptosporangiaceae bacterium]
MTRITPELDRLAAARPETARHAAALTDEGARQALLTAIMADEHPQRPRLRHHRWPMPVAAAAASAAVVLGLGLSGAFGSASHQPSHPAHARLAAWTVIKQADGDITVTIRQLQDPAGLQSTLRADGVPASVTFSGQQNPACTGYPGGQGNSLLSRIVTPQPVNTGDAMTMNPSAIPSGAGLQIYSTNDPNAPEPGVNIGVGLVQASQQCTGS